jgi:DtxR family transcriptional regulator, Mn-dependent transcriptional regulator
LSRHLVWRTLAVLAVVGVAVYLVSTRPIRLGLDLEGGTQIVLQAQDTESQRIDDDTLTRTLEVMLARKGGAAHTDVLAESVGVTPGTVTAAVKRLDERGLLAYQPYKGVELSERGRKVAVAAIRRHRIVERFLSDMLGYEWNEADRLAGSFEHDLPQEVEDRLYIALDRPSTCPHGFPIPESTAEDVPKLPTLYALEPGDVAIVAVPGSVDPAVIAFLDTLGLRPGVEVEVREKHPFDGPLVLRVAGKDRTVGEKVASQIYVRQLTAGRNRSASTPGEANERAAVGGAPTKKNAG